MLVLDLWAVPPPSTCNRVSLSHIYIYINSGLARLLDAFEMVMSMDSVDVFIPSIFLFLCNLCYSVSPTYPSPTYPSPTHSSHPYPSTPYPSTPYASPPTRHPLPLTHLPLNPLRPSYPIAILPGPLRAPTKTCSVLLTSSCTDKTRIYFLPLQKITRGV